MKSIFNTQVSALALTAMLALTGNNAFATNALAEKAEDAAATKSSSAMASAPVTNLHNVQALGQDPLHNASSAAPLAGTTSAPGLPSSLGQPDPNNVLHASASAVPSAVPSSVASSNPLTAAAANLQSTATNPSSGLSAVSSALPSASSSSTTSGLGTGLNDLHSAVSSATPSSSSSNPLTAAASNLQSTASSLNAGLGAAPSLSSNPLTAAASTVQAGLGNLASSASSTNPLSGAAPSLSSGNPLTAATGLQNVASNLGSGLSAASSSTPLSARTTLLNSGTVLSGIGIDQNDPTYLALAQQALNIDGLTNTNITKDTLDTLQDLNAINKLNPTANLPLTPDSITTLQTLQSLGQSSTLTNFNNLQLAKQYNPNATLAQLMGDMNAIKFFKANSTSSQNPTQDQHDAIKSTESPDALGNLQSDPDLRNKVKATMIGYGAANNQDVPAFVAQLCNDASYPVTGLLVIWPNNVDKLMGPNYSNGHVVSTQSDALKQLLGLQNLSQGALIAGSGVTSTVIKTSNGGNITRYSVTNPYQLPAQTTQQ